MASAGAIESRTLPGFMWWRQLVLAASIIAVSVLRYATNAPSQTFLHEIALRLYYVPILIGAYWYGVPGGLVMAIVSSIAYVNRVSEIVHTLDRGRLAEVVVFHLIGASVGILANAQRRVARRYQTAAATLEQANATLRESHEQIRRMDRLRTLGEVATGLAHEIRHPLASIGGALEIIQARATAGTPEAEFSHLALKEVQRLDLLVWEFLRYARPHAPELRTVALDQVVEQAVTLLRVEADRAGVQLEVEPSGAPIDVTIDPLQIEQVLLNVLLNAIQATPAGGRVLVQERLDGTEACVDVIDEGHGIDAEHLSSIFNPFFTTRDKGTGLGLAIAHRIVMSHDGRLDVVQTSARGTWFRVGLPVHRISGAAAPRQVAAMPS
jgi:two-component system, NtrC family, sensor histidine kinase HydH